MPIARFTADPTVLAVRADSPWNTLAEFVADARKRPGAITYGSSGNYGTMHVPMEMFAASAGIKLLHVPYTGAGPAVVALLGGNVDALASGPSTVIQHVKAGKLRVLASWGDKRLASLPDVPTLTESGYDAVFFQWAALFAPAGNAGARHCAPARRRARRRRRSAASSRRWRPSKRRSSTSMRPSCSGSGRPTRNSSPKPCGASARSSDDAARVVADWISRDANSAAVGDLRRQSRRSAWQRSVSRAHPRVANATLWVPARPRSATHRRQVAVATHHALATQDATQQHYRLPT